MAHLPKTSVCLARVLFAALYCACLPHAHAAKEADSEKAMGRAYTALEASHAKGSAPRTALAASQVAWMAYRKAACAHVTAGLKGEAARRCPQVLAQERADNLQAYVKGEPLAPEMVQAKALAAAIDRLAARDQVSAAEIRDSLHSGCDDGGPAAQLRCTRRHRDVADFMREDAEAALAQRHGAGSPLAAPLAEAQRAWGVYRDAACKDYEAARWAPGPEGETNVLMCEKQLADQRRRTVEGYLNSLPQ